jgi:hypothetical protein
MTTIFCHKAIATRINVVEPEITHIVIGWSWYKRAIHDCRLRGGACLSVSSSLYLISIDIILFAS